MEEVEEVYDQIEEEHQKFNHIFEIKKLLVNNENETDTEIRISLQKLALIVVTFEDLKVTNIGKIVRSLQMHRSKKVSREAKRTTKKFNRIKEIRFGENADLSTRTRGLDPPTVAYNIPIDKGLPIGYIPKLDFATFFEDIIINDDGNSITHNLEREEFHKSKTKPSAEKNAEISSSTAISTTGKQKQEVRDKLISPIKYASPLKNREIGMINECSQLISTKRQTQSAKRKTKENWNRGYIPSDTQFSLKRFAQHKENQRSSICVPTPRHSRGTVDDAPNMEEKLEASKRKLHQRYEAHKKGRRSIRYFEGQEYVVPKDERSRRRSRPWYKNRRYN